MKKSFYILIAVVVVVAAGAGIMWAMRGGKQDVTGGDMDEHGCIPSAGYQWCEAKQECIRFWEEKCDDDHMRESISLLVEDIKTQIGIDLGDADEQEMEWFYEDGDDVSSIGVLSNEYTLEEASDGDYQAIHQYLLQNGFTGDPYNMSAGTVSGVEGYQNGLEVCKLGYSLEGLDDSAGQSVTLTCGLLDEIEIIDEPLIDTLKELFTKELEVKVSQVNIEIEMQEDEHVRGLVSFDGVDAEIDGLFFAYKTWTGWQLIPVGNNVFDCQYLIDRGFSDEMIDGCVGK